MAPVTVLCRMESAMTVGHVVCSGHIWNMTQTTEIRWMAPSSLWKVGFNCTVLRMFCSDCRLQFPLSARSEITMTYQVWHAKALQWLQRTEWDLSKVRNDTRPRRQAARNEADFDRWEDIQTNIDAVFRAQLICFSSEKRELKNTASIGSESDWIVFMRSSK